MFARNGGVRIEPSVFKFWNCLSFRAPAKLIGRLCHDFLVGCAQVARSLGSPAGKKEFWKHKTTTTAQELGGCPNVQSKRGWGPCIRERFASEERVFFSFYNRVQVLLSLAVHFERAAETGGPRSILNPMRWALSD